MLIYLLKPSRAVNNYNLYFKRDKIKRGDRRMSGAVGESVWSAVDAPPHHPPTRTVIELREPLLTDN